VDPDGPGSPGQRPPVAPAARVPAVVVELLPSAMYRVRLEVHGLHGVDGLHRGQLVLAHVADRIDRNFVRVLVGDRVFVELSAADAGRGRIVAKI
jgi:translation initiation factor IF-1